MKFRMYNIILIMFLSFFTSCSKETEQDNKLRRTILVYIGRDNDLSGISEEKIDYLLQGWDESYGNLVIYQDKKGENPCLIAACEHQGEKYARIIKEYSHENSAGVDVFKRVMYEAFDQFPADSYGLIVFSHASGWLPAEVFPSLRSIIKDREDEMELIDFASVIPDKQFEFIIFEACFMAGIEVVYELKNKTNYILASSAEVLSPGFRKTYAEKLYYLFLPQPDLISFADDIFSRYNNKTGAYRSATISVIKTDKLTDLAEYLKNNIIDYNIEDIHNIQHFDRKNVHLFFDFEDYYIKILNEKSKNNISEYIGNCVVYKAATPLFMLEYGGFRINTHSGLTTYIRQERFPELDIAYKNLQWHKDVFSR